MDWSHNAQEMPSKTLFFEKKWKEEQKWREEENVDVSSYWPILGKREDAGN